MVNDHQAVPPQDSVACQICGAPAFYDFSGRDLMFDLHERHDYFACATCRFVFQHPTPSREKIASFYPENYDIYDEGSRIREVSPLRAALLKHKCGYRHLHPPLIHSLIATLAAPFVRLSAPTWEGGGRLLDVGCGNGRYLTAMRRLGWDVEGVEFSETGVNVARRSGLQVHHGDIFSAAFASGHFDLVTVRHVIEHVPDPHAFFTELVRVLRPGGRLVIETPNSEALGRQWLAGNWFANEVPRHLHLFSSQNLKLLGTTHGMKLVRLLMDTSPKIFLNSLDYVINNRGRPSKRIPWRRFLARIYVALARRSGRGDVMQMIFVKPTP